MYLGCMTTEPKQLRRATGGLIVRTYIHIGVEFIRLPYFKPSTFISSVVVAGSKLSSIQPRALSEFLNTLG